MYLQLNYTSSNVKVAGLTFISASKKIIKLSKYISTHIMLFHSIKQYLIIFISFFQYYSLTVLFLRKLRIFTK